MKRNRRGHGKRPGRRSSGGPRSSRVSRAIPAAREKEVVLFLRDWLPRHALATYRRMMLADPDEWHRSAHFQGGIVVRHFLRGNGITARVLGVDNLEEIWPRILRAAVLAEDPVPAGADRGIR